MAGVKPQLGKTDPIHTYHFSIEIQGLEAARFSEASAIEHTSKVIEHRETDAQGNIYINKTIGSTSFTDVTVKRGVTFDNDMWNKWRQHVMDGDYDQARKKVTIHVWPPKGDEPTASFVMDRCWISKWKGPAFSTKTDNVAFEEITFTHEGISRAK